MNSFIAEFPLKETAAAELLLIISLLFPDLPFRHAVIHPVIFSLYLSNLLLHEQIQNRFIAYFTGAVLSTAIFRASTLLLLPSLGYPAPIRDGETPKSVFELTLWGRVNRTIHLMSSTRGIGWNFRVPKSINPPPLYKSRTSFVVYRLLAGLVFYLALDAAETLQQSSPWLVDIMSDAPGTATVASQKFITRMAFAISWALGAFCLLEMGMCLFSAIAVLLGSSEPKEWPMIFSSPIHAYSIRRTWG